MSRAIRVKAANPEALPGTRTLRLGERQQFFAILAIALLQGVLFIAVVPPWQHYDEPTHFEYAWLLAHLRRQPYPGDENAVMRRDVQASMAAHGFFDPNPTLIEDDPGRIWIGYSELGHPPGYYALAALPIAFLSQLDVTSQLYLARLVSLALFILTVAIAWATASELAPPDDPLRLLVPLIVALLPTFADVMTSVNNDVGAVFVLSLLIWGAVRMIRWGFTWQRLLWVLSTAVLGVFTKNTAMYGLLLAPVAIFFTLSIRNGWSLRRLPAVLLVLSVTALLALFSWGDAAHWYRADTVLTQHSATRIATPSATEGSYAFLVESDAASPQRGLLYPLHDMEVSALSGKTVTLGAWVWADRNADLVPLELDIAAKGHATFRRYGQPARLTTEPIFIAQSLEMPADLQRAQISLAAASAPGDPPLRVFFDGIVLVEGAFDDAAPPQFSDAHAREGTWNGRTFTNLLGEASAEQAWPRPRSWLDDRLRSVVRHRPSDVILAIFDTNRTGGLLVEWAVPLAVDGLVERFAWSQVQLPGDGWTWGLRIAVALALAGCTWWAIRYGRRQPASRNAALTFLVVALAIVWGATVLRPLPMLGPALIAPGTRYAFPAIVPTAIALAGGWLSVWPGRRSTAALLVVSALLVLETVSLISIRAFYGAP